MFVLVERERQRRIGKKERDEKVKCNGVKDIIIEINNDVIAVISVVQYNFVESFKLQLFQFNSI